MYLREQITPTQDMSASLALRLRNLEEKEGETLQQIQDLREDLHNIRRCVDCEDDCHSSKLLLMYVSGR